MLSGSQGRPTTMPCSVVRRPSRERERATGLALFGAPAPHALSKHKACTSRLDVFVGLKWWQRGLGAKSCPSVGKCCTTRWLLSGCCAGRSPRCTNLTEVGSRFMPLTR